MDPKEEGTATSAAGPSSASSSQSGDGLPNLNESPSPASFIKHIREEVFSSQKKVPDLNESPEDEEKKAEIRTRIHHLIRKLEKKVTGENI